MNRKLLLFFNKTNNLQRFLSQYTTKHVNRNTFSTKLILGTSLTLFGCYFYKNKFNKQVYAKENVPQPHQCGNFRKDLPNYSLDEISKHSSK